MRPRLPLLTALLAASLACSSAATVLAPRHPAQARPGRLEVRRQRQGVSFRLSVDRAAETTWALPGNTILVVWVREQAGRPPRNLGPLTLLWPEGRGRAYGTVPAEDFDVLVTAERDLGGREPGGPVVLEGSVGRGCPPASVAAARP